MVKKAQHIYPSAADGKEVITVIGGGLSGCVSALMLARQGYHVNLIEKNDELLTGSSRVAARLHRGLEYPKDPISAIDCMKSAVMWKLLMPDNITTAPPPMKAVLSKRSQELGEIKETNEMLKRANLSSQIRRELTDEEDLDALTLDSYNNVFEKVRQEYEELFKRIRSDMGWTKEQTEADLLGSYEKGRFYRALSEDELRECKIPNIVGGFQTQEEGLNIPKYLSMIQKAIEDERDKGNITLFTGHKVLPLKEEGGGIRGQFGDFHVRCEKEDGSQVIVHSSQLVQAANSGGPAITPQIGKAGEHGRAMTVYRRAILEVDLPEGWQHDPFFKLVGSDGCMVAPYNDKVALVYTLMHDIPTINKVDLFYDSPDLPDNWEHMPPESKKALTDAFFNYAKRSYPPLAGATNPRVLIADTINFQDVVTKRRDKNTREETIAPAMAPSMSIRPMLQQRQMIENVTRDPLIELKKGLFTMYATKVTHGPNAAFQAAALVMQRSKDHEKEKVELSDPLFELLHIGDLDTKDSLKQFSLKDLAVPDIEYQRAFCKSHDINEKILIESWPTKDVAKTWQEGDTGPGGWRRGL